MSSLAFLCFLSFGMDCPSDAGDNDRHFRTRPPIEDNGGGMTNPVPEPGAALLFGTGVVVLGAVIRRNKS